jgi:long-chain acyl-CoA synthetase
MSVRECAGEPLRLDDVRPLVRTFVERAHATPERLAFAVFPRGSSVATRTVTWRAWYEDARALAVNLIQRGVAPGDRVVIHAGNCMLWPIADMAVQMLGAVGVGVYPSATEAQALALYADCDARVVLHDRDAAWMDAVRDGHTLLAQDPTLADVVQARTTAITLDTLAALIYTSGSTGEPKGACLSHRYLAASAASIAQVLALTEEDRALSFLPYSHAAERVFGQCTRVLTGMSAALIEDPADVFRVAATFEPTVLGGLPRIFERLYEAVEVARRAGTSPHEAIRSRIGSRCRIATSGGAAMPTAIATELAALGLPILGAYGQTEHLCVAMNRAEGVQFDTVGPPMPGTRVRIGDDGEVLVAAGPLSFSGYWRRDDATRDAFTSDGTWIRTGDRGVLRDDGMLQITGRIKELIALSTGRKVAPVPIEASLTASPYIAHAVCIGEGRKYLVAVLSLRRTVLEAWAREAQMPVVWEQLVVDPHVVALVQHEVDRVNATLSRTDRVQQILLTGDEFTVDSGLLTPTSKVVRQRVSDRYAAAIEGMYRS